MTSPDFTFNFTFRNALSGEHAEVSVDAWAMEDAKERAKIVLAGLEAKADWEFLSGSKVRKEVIA